MPIDVFCVEHGRWEGRSVATTTSQLGSTEFNGNHSLIVSQTAPVDELAKEAKGGKFVASVGQLNKDSRLAVQGSGAQGKSGRKSPRQTPRSATGPTPEISPPTTIRATLLRISNRSSKS